MKRAALRFMVGMLLACTQSVQATETEMPNSVAPPRGYEMVTGEWGVDADIDDDSLTGPWSLKFTAGSSIETEVMGPPFAIEGGRTYQVTSTIKEPTGAGTLTVIVTTYDIGGDVVATTNVFSGFTDPVFSSDWARIGGTFTADEDAVIARVSVKKSAVNTGFGVDYDVWWDNVDPQEIGPMAGFSTEAGTSVPASTETPLAFGAIDWYVEGGIRTVGSLIQTDIGGVYQINARAEVGAITNGRYARLEVRVFPPGSITPTFTRFGPRHYNGDTVAHALSAGISIAVPVVAGGRIGIYMFHNDTTARTVSTSANDTWAQIIHQRG